MTEVELIHYNLNFVIAGHESEEIQWLIAKTISRLPDELREKVTQEVTFISVDGVYGHYSRLEPSIFQNGAIDLIALNLTGIIDEEEKMYVIAHEIAHFILGHMFSPEQTGDIETEVDELCEKWGFTIPEGRKH